MTRILVFQSKIPETEISTPTNGPYFKKNPQDFFNNFGFRFIDIILKERFNARQRKKDFIEM